MRGRWAGAGAVALAVAVLTPGCAVGPTACPAIGYVYSGPAVLEFTPALPASASLAACFGAGCAPSALTIVERTRVEVPQQTPYATPPAGDTSLITVRVTDAGSVLIDQTFTIGHKAEAPVFGSCPGPFSFEPVAVTLAG
ncbi:hypothetical protein [Microbacterium ginsengisoli]|jgi:hypothetical protein|uniref:hypothetical protein n=1 Tax=Microbacterium ginsengisoli TaxID=400772 RepID=UPI0012ECE425|nr:hypothetical protein [Microbacterium ginsengisoli]